MRPSPWEECSRSGLSRCTRWLDPYVAEQARVPRELGDPCPPESGTKLLDRLREHRRSLAVDEQTRWIGSWLASPGLPRALLVALPAYRLTGRYPAALAA